MRHLIRAWADIGRLLGFLSPSNCFGSSLPPSSASTPQQRLRCYDRSAQVSHSSRPSHSDAAPLRTQPSRRRRRRSRSGSPLRRVASTPAPARPPPRRPLHLQDPVPPARLPAPFLSLPPPPPAAAIAAGRHNGQGLCGGAGIFIYSAAGYAICL